MEGEKEDIKPYRGSPHIAFGVCFMFLVYNAPVEEVGKPLTVIRIYQVKEWRLWKVK